MILFIMLMTPVVAMIAAGIARTAADNSDRAWNMQSRRARAKNFRKWRAGHKSANWAVYTM